MLNQTGIQGELEFLFICAIIVVAAIGIFAARKGRVGAAVGIAAGVLVGTLVFSLSDADQAREVGDKVTSTLIEP